VLMAALPWSEEFERVLRSHCRFIDASDSIDPSAEFVELGVDSFELLHLMFDCEASFAIEFGDDELVGYFFATPGALWSALQELLTERKSEVE
jgi:acyl carrier protein